MIQIIDILEPFFIKPNYEFHVREIAKILKITPATASKKLKELKKRGLLNYRKKSVLHFYSANLDSQKYLDVKLYYTIRRIRECGLLKELNDFYVEPTIVLFGSAAFGLDTKKSDIDILVISEKTKEFQNLRKYETKLHRNFQVFLHKTIKDIENKNLVNSMLNGIVLQGEIKWI